MGPSPAGSTPGGTPNGAPRPPMPRRPPQPANPLLAPKRRQRQAPANNAPTRVRPKDDALKAPSDIKPVTSTTGSSKLLPPNTAVSLIDASTGTKTSGFSNPPTGPYVDYPVYMSKRQIIEGARFHVARFYTKQEVDPSSEDQWTRPVRLHRRDPKAPPPGGKPQELDAKDAELEEERTKQEMHRAQREAQRAAEQAEIAPSQANPNSKKPGAGLKKITQVLRKDETEAQRASTQLKYEEALPWLIEDFDNRQAWVSSYEAALSGTYTQFILKDGKFHVVPIEKWYKFTQRRNFKSQEELEAQEAKRQTKDPKWLRAFQEGLEVKKAEEMNRRVTSRLYDGAGKGRTANLGGGGRGGGSKKDKEDADELDFEEDIADDEEDPVYEGDVDETKETQKRIKKDQLQANIFDMKDEETYDKEEQREKLEKQTRKDEGKRVRKALMKRERNYIYDSDSDHPYSEASESEDSEAEREEDEKKEGEEKKKTGLAQSGVSSKGTNTPSGRKSGLKRPSSHDVSEASGNESSRKKQKKHGTSSNLGSGVNTPNGPPSRPRSPANGTVGLDANAARLKKPSTTRGNDLKRPRPGGAGSGSDGEGAGSGGEMSDASRKKIKLKSSQPGSKNVSPGGSRATSPNRDSTDRPAKPTKEPLATPLPGIDVIKGDIAPEGIKLSRFSEKYRAYFENAKTRDPFMAMVRTISKVDKRSDGTYIILLP